MSTLRSTTLSVLLALAAMDATAQALTDCAPPRDAAAPVVDRNGDRDAILGALEPGDTLLRIVVGDHGRAESIAIEVSSGDAAADALAVEAAGTWPLARSRRLMYLPMSFRTSENAPPAPVERRDTQRLPFKTLRDAVVSLCSRSDVRVVRIENDVVYMDGDVVWRLHTLQDGNGQLLTRIRTVPGRRQSTRYVGWICDAPRKSCSAALRTRHPDVVKR